MLARMLIRTATAEDWPAIWAFLRRIVAAGETYTYPRDLDEDRARDIWMPSPRAVPPSPPIPTARSWARPR